jgi:glutamate transport system substrate-binding protein
MLKRCLRVLAVLLLLLTAACYRQPLPATDWLTVGVHADVPGWGRSVGGDWSGYDYNLARWLGNEVDRNVRPYDTLSLNREKLLEDGTVDAVVATYSITDKRLADVDMIGPYLIAYQGILVRAADEQKLTAARPQQLTGCVQEGSTSQEQLDQYGFDNFSASATLTECFARLDAGTVQAVSTDDLVLYGFVNQHPGRYAILDTRIGHLEQYGIGVRKGNTALCEQLHSALTTFIAAGLWQTFLANNLPTMPPAEYAKHSPAKAAQLSCSAP